MRVLKSLVLGATVFFLLLTSGFAAGASPSDVIFQESKKEPVAPGITYEQIWQFTAAGWLKLHILRADLTRADVRADLLLPGGGLATGEPLSRMAERAGAVAAINGDFFFGRGFVAPLGPVVRDGRLISSPSLRSDLAAFGLRQDGGAVLDYWTFQGTVLAADGASFRLAGWNKPGETYRELYAYDEDWGRTTPAGVTRDGLAAVITGGRVTSLLPANGGVAIPRGATVLVGAGPAAEFLANHLPVGSQVTVTTTTTPARQDLAWALGGGSVLVRDGRVVPFTHEVKGTAARSAVGVTRDGRELLLVAVDGRQEESRGLTQVEWAGLLLELGAYQALNLDGGGSSTVLARLPGLTRAELVNVPSDGKERSLGNGIGLFSSAPQGELAGLVVTAADNRIVARGKRTLTVKGYDVNYHPVAIDLNKVKWTVEPASLGSVRAGVFTARTSGRGKIIARLGRAKGELPIQVTGPAIRLELTPQQVALPPGGETEISVYARDAQGYRALLEPGDVRWRVLGDVGSVAAGKFTARAEPGTGALEARFGTLSARTLVSVGEEEKTLLYFELLQGLSFASQPAGRGGIASATYPEPVHGHNRSLRLEYDFTAGEGTRAAYLVFQPGLALPDGAEKLSLWVYGDGQGHWLRALVADKNGREFPVDFARTVDWHGWERVEAKLPSGAYPYTLKRIYLVEPDPAKRDAGRIYLDDLAAITALPFAAELASPASPLPDPHYTKAPVPAGLRFLVAGSLPERPEGVEWVSGLKDGVRKNKAAFLISLTPLPEEARAAWEKALGVPVRASGTAARWDAKTAAFYSLNAAGGTLTQGGAEEWQWLQSDLAALKGKRQLFVFLDRRPFAGPDGFTSRPEADLLRRRLREAGERLKAMVWVFAPGAAGGTEWEDGVRFQCLGQAAPGEVPHIALVSVESTKATYTWLGL